MKKIRIFISSPGDVLQERIIAKKVITELNKTFSKYFIIEPLLWEDMPLLASSSFQEGIDQIINKYAIDVAVFILWSRLGSNLGNSYLKSDGTPYQSGTEYEFDMMMEAFRKNGRPQIMVYIKDTPLKDRLLHAQDDDLEEVIRQHGAVKNFIKEHFHDEETGTNYAYTIFGEEVSFGTRLKTHLTNILLEAIGTNDLVIEWQGNPYVGLDSYEPEQSSIFFGREKAVNSMMSVVLGELANCRMPSIILLGESGSGKSSLVKAGLFPLLQNLDNSQQFILEKTTPALLGENLYVNFVSLFFKNYEQLKDNPVYDEMIKGIPENYNFSHLEFALKNYESHVIPVLFIDQFEELFSDTRISEEQRLMILRLIRGLTETRHVFLVISMRNDFYSKFASYSDLSKIKQMVSMTCDVPTMDTTELASVVREPARMAGLEWEVGRNGHSLDMEIVNEATQIKNLPLIEFALSELYKSRDEKGILTFEAYNKIGGLKGAFTNYANGVYDSLSEEEKKAFLDILGRVVTISRTDDKTFVRKTVLLSECESSSVHTGVIRKLVDAHIFTSGKNLKGEAIFTIAHEMLLTEWDVIKRWTNQEHSFISDNDYYEKCARHWLETGKSHSLLLKDKVSVLKAEYFYYWWHDLCSSSTKNFLEKSFFRCGLFKKIFLAIIAVSCSLFFLYTLFSGKFFKDGVLFGGWNIIECIVFICPIWTIVYSYFKCGPYYKVSKTIRNAWILFFAFQFISLIINFIFFRDKNNAVIAGSDILTIPVVLLVVIDTINKRQIRKKWAVKKFKVPLLYFIFNWDRYKVLSPFLASFILLISLLFMYMACEESKRNEAATAHADNLFDILEENEDALNRGFFYETNENRADYLKNVFNSALEDSTSVNDRQFELARTFYYRCIPDSALALLKHATLPEHLTLKAKAFLQKGKFKEAAQCLNMPCKSLVSALPQHWMNLEDPLDIFMLAGDVKSAKQYCEALLTKYEALRGTGFMYRINAVLAIPDNMDAVKDNYIKYMKYLTGSGEDEQPIGNLISLSSFVMAKRLSASQAYDIINAYNEEVNKFPKDSPQAKSVENIINLAVCNSPTQPWQNWINGSWRALQSFVDSSVWMYDFSFEEGAVIFKEYSQLDDGLLYVEEYQACPCRFVKFGNYEAFEAITPKGHILFQIISSSETAFTGYFDVDEKHSVLWTFERR